MGGNSCCFRTEIKDEDGESKGIYVGDENPRDYSTHLKRAARRASPTKLNMELQEADPEEFRRQLKIAVVQTNVRIREYEEGRGYKTYNNEH